MYKVIKPFRDKYNHKKIYRVGEGFISDDNERIKDLISRGLIEGVSDETPSINIAEKNAYELMNKKKLEKELQDRGIKYNKRQTKAELIELLLKSGD